MSCRYACERAEGLVKLRCQLTVEVTVMVTRLSAISSNIQIYIAAPVTSRFCLSHSEAADFVPSRLMIGSYTCRNKVIVRKEGIVFAFAIL